MNCNEFEKLASELADYELSEEVAEGARNHLRGCSKCGRLYELELSTKRAVTSLSVKSAPDGLRDRVLGAISEDNPGFGGTRVIRPNSWLWGFVSNRGIAFSTAAAAIVLTGLFLTVALLYGGRGISPFVSDVYAYHTDPGQVAVDATDDASEIHDCLEDRLHRNIPVPTLASLGCKLKGVSEEFDIASRHCAFLRFSYATRDVSHFVICCTDVPIRKLDVVAGNPQYRAHNENGINMIFWRCDATKTTRVLVSDCSLQELFKVAEQIRKESREILACED
jgi:anti-sigma factor (TIGR02949 family)